MSKAIIKAGGVCALLSFALLAKGQDANTKALNDDVKMLQSDLRNLEVIEAAQAAAPNAHDLQTAAADLGAIATSLKIIRMDLNNATALPNDLAAFKATLGIFENDENSFHSGPPTGDQFIIAENFKYALSDIDSFTNDLKLAVTLQKQPASVSADLGVMALDLTRLAPGLPEAAQQKLADVGRHGTNNSWGSILLWIGARLDNPYSIDITNVTVTTKTGTTTNKVASLKSGNSTTDGYVGFNVNLRYIFRSDRYEDEYWQKDPAWMKSKNGHLQLYDPFALTPDIDFSLGYAFTGSSAPSNYTASTVAGGGDISMDSSVGFPILRYKPTVDRDTNTLKLQVTLPEIGGGVDTDKKFLIAHPNIFAGVGFQLAAPAKDFYWMGRLGCSWVDEPKMVSGSKVALDSLGNPEFKQLQSAVTMGASMVYRITDALAAKVAGNVYLTGVGSWNISAAVSIDPTKFFSSLK